MSEDHHKNKKQVMREVSPYDFPVNGHFDSLEWVRPLLTAAEGLDDVVVEWATDWDGSDGHFEVKGWRSMTEKEVAKAKAARERAKRASDTKKQKEIESERREYERLAKKFGGRS